MEWLREKRDSTVLREQRVEALKWDILIFVEIEVLHDLPQMVG
jgi:hypothetical protein